MICFFESKSNFHLPKLHLPCIIGPSLRREKRSLWRVSGESPLLQQSEIGSFSFCLGVDFVIRRCGVNLIRLYFSFNMLMSETNLKSCRVLRRSVVLGFYRFRPFLGNSEIEAGKCIWSLDFMRRMIYR